MDLDYTANRYLPVSWEQMHRDTRLLSASLMELENIKGIVCVSRGGLVPGTVIARELDIRYVDTICIVSYDDKTQGEAKVLKCPEGDGEGIIVIDDLVDSGRTLQIVKKLLPKAHIATVYAKPMAQEIVDTFVVPVDQDVWLMFPWDMEMLPNAPMVEAKRKKQS